MMSKKIHGYVLILLSILLFCNCSNNTKSENIQTVMVTKRDIGKTVLATGIIKPKVGAEVKVGSRVSGIVKKLYVQIGDNVEEGQLLAELDPTEYQARLNLAIAEMENAKASLEYSKSDLDRQKALLEKTLISKNEYEIAQRADKIAEAKLKQAEANYKYAKIQLDYTKIKSPISGIVASVFTQEGETVAASFSAPTFVTIIDLTRLEVWAYVDEIDIGRIKEDQESTFLVDTYPDAEFSGKVTAIFPKAEIQDNVVNYISTIEITDRQDKTLRPEMTTTVNIYLETHKNVLSVENEVVKSERGRKYVYMMQENKPVKKFIKTGIRNEDYTQIVEGLEEGDLVVLGNIDAEA